MTCPHARAEPYHVSPNGSVDGRCAACGAVGLPISERPPWAPKVPRIAVVGSRSLHPPHGAHPQARAWVRELVGTLGGWASGEMLDEVYAHVHAAHIREQVARTALGSR